MKGYSAKGAITVFLSLVSVLFLSLICTAVESARVQGAKGKAAAVLDMGMFSVMGEFEREMLSKYDLFFLDGAAGSGSYSEDGVTATLADFMEYNVDPNMGEWIPRYDPFAMELTDAEITGVGLATDDNGAPFYQQAVRFMRENLATEVITMWMERLRQGEEMKKAEDSYKNQESNITAQLAQIEEQKRLLEEQQKQQAEDGSVVIEPQYQVAPVEKTNPLDIIKKLKKEGILGLVLKDKSKVSTKEISSDRASKRRCKKGTLPVKKEYGGLIDNLIFQEYLFERFSLFTDEEREGALDYALEYILCGKDTDEKNLKSVVNRLLLLREGVNFLYLSLDETSMMAAQGLAASLVGWVPVPGVVTATGYALLLAWAYGESLLDVRSLLAGGKVPLVKSADTWKLGLSSLGSILTELDREDGSDGRGLSYADHLQILFTMGDQGKYPMRALDLIESYMQSRKQTASFHIDHAIFQIAAKADFHVPQQFLRVSSAFMRTGMADFDFQVTGSFAY